MQHEFASLSQCVLTLCSVFAGLATMILLAGVPGFVAKLYYGVQADKMKKVRTLISQLSMHHRTRPPDSRPMPECKSLQRVSSVASMKCVHS